MEAEVCDCSIFQAVTFHFPKWKEIFFGIVVINILPLWFYWLMASSITVCKSKLPPGITNGSLPTPYPTTTPQHFRSSTKTRLS